MKKIYFFCCWSHGLNYLKEVFQELDKHSDIDISFLHFDSINLPGKKLPNNYNRIRLVNFMPTYNTWNLFKFIKEEKPDKILVIDKGSLLMRSVLLIANQLKIPSIHIQEGNIPDLSNVNLLNNKTQKKSLGGGIGIFNILKDIKKIVFAYGVYVITYLNIPPWRIFNVKFFKYSFFVIKNPKYHNWFQRKEVKASRAFCYGQRDVEYFIKIDGYAPDEVKAIGKPEFYNVLLKKRRWDSSHALEQIKNQLCARYKINPEKKIVTLLSQPFLEDALYSTVTKESKLDHLTELYKGICSLGFSFIDKLHPRENKVFLLDAYSNESDIFFINDYDLDKLIYCSDIILGYFSTALINAVIFRKHPLIIGWGPGTEEYFFDLQRYKVGTKVSGINELRSKISCLNNGRLRTCPLAYQTFYDSFININIHAPPENEIVQAILS